MIHFVSLLFSSHNSGKTGDWKNMFTEEQNQCFESVYKSKMQGCTLKFVWEEQDKKETKTTGQIPQKSTEP